MSSGELRGSWSGDDVVARGRLDQEERADKMVSKCGHKEADATVKSNSQRTLRCA